MMAMGERKVWYDAPHNNKGKNGRTLPTSVLDYASTSFQRDTTFYVWNSPHLWVAMPPSLLVSSQTHTTRRALSPWSPTTRRFLSVNQGPHEPVEYTTNFVSRIKIFQWRNLTKPKGWPPQAIHTTRLKGVYCTFKDMKTIVVIPSHQMRFSLVQSDLSVNSHTVVDRHGTHFKNGVRVPTIKVGQPKSSIVYLETISQATATNLQTQS